MVNITPTRHQYVHIVIVSMLTESTAVLCWLSLYCFASIKSFSADFFFFDS